jgi:hypothetical protein
LNIPLQVDVTLESIPDGYSADHTRLGKKLPDGCGLDQFFSNSSGMIAETFIFSSGMIILRAVFP